MGDRSYFRMGLLAAFLASQGACVGHDDACGGSTSDFPYCGDDQEPVSENPGGGDGVTGGGASPPPAAEPGGMDAGSGADPDDTDADVGIDADGGPEAASEPPRITCDGVWTPTGVVGEWTCRGVTGE